ncbi:MAG: GNAT family N-acetyltransferase [Anaerolineales bacterium]
MSAIIRHYSPKDRQDVFRIAADTAYFGDQVEHFMEDRTLFCDAFCTYYTDFEPQNAWVAEENGRVVGYLLGCSDTKTQQKVILNKIIPQLILDIFRRKYVIGRLTLHYGYGLILSALYGQNVHADLQSYPAHFHLNIESGKRGAGIGRRLLEEFINKMNEDGIHGIHLKTTSENKAACALYEKLNFKLIDAKKTVLWRYWLKRIIENRCYGLILHQFSQ